MAEEKRKDYSFELLGAIVFFLLLVLLCYFHVICPLPSCPEGLVQCNNCPGNCCLPDGSCPCPQGSVPCSNYCPETLNCPSGCCNIDTCECTATPQCPPNTVWSESRGCCIFMSGPNVGNCADKCTADPNRISCPISGMDSCDSNKCCPLGSLGWDSLQNCCVDSLGNCISTCNIDSSRLACPTPMVGGCDATRCCPQDTYWDTDMNCCLTSDGFCYGDPCIGVTCPTGQVCVNGACTNQTDLCTGKICENGFCDPETGDCVYLTCNDIQCPEGYVCIDNSCVQDLCKNVVCPSGQECDPRTGDCGVASCSSNDQCKVCDKSRSVCGGVNGSKECTNDSDCADVECLPDGKCGESTGTGGTGGTGENVGQGGLGNLVDCEYKPSSTNCPPDVICSNGCADEIKCTDPRLPEGQCKGIGEACSNSTECCCGTNCQIVNGEGVCCPGGLWVCGIQPE